MPKQLCLANREMKAEYVKETLKRLREDSSVDFIQVSQNDWFGCCECEACKVLMEEDGGVPSGPYLRFANEVAAAVEKEFPSVRIDTFAYQFTRKAPSKTRPRHNVVVRLCDIECDFARPLADPSSPLNAKFAKDIHAKIPKGVTVKRTPTDLGVTLSLIFSPAYVKEKGNGVLKVPVTYGKKNVGVLQIFWR